MKLKISLSTCLLIFSLFSCKKLVEIDPPRTSLTSEAVFSNDEAAIAAVTQLYAAAAGSGLEQANILGLCNIPALSADELVIFGTNGLTQFNNNSLTALNISQDFWSRFYSTYIYNTNRIIEKLSEQKSSEEDPTSKLSTKVKKQLLGEAHFLRAFTYFYLIQMYGDVPLLLSSNYVVNSTASKTNKEIVYSQVIKDLKEADSNLSSVYLQRDLTTSLSTSPRVRPIKWAAKALLARVYLYTKDYQGAEMESKAVINNSALYSLTTLENVFKANSTEAIWQLQPVIFGRNTQEAWMFTLIPNALPSSFEYLNALLLNSFEKGDQRKIAWVGNVTVNNSTYSFPYKYKANSISTTANATEYSMVLRLAEQYLICAEACAKQNKILEAQEMLNFIRKRAGLNNTTANTEESLLDAILAERRVELFSEFGHRWFDLKRTGKIDEVMRIATPLKSGQDWETFQAYYPILPSQIALNKNVTQTPGY